VDKKRKKFLHLWFLQNLLFTGDFRAAYQSVPLHQQYPKYLYGLHTAGEVRPNASSGYVQATFPLSATRKARVDGAETGNVDGKAIRTDLERAVTSPAVR